MKTFHSRLKRLRLRRGLSVKEVAKKLNIAESTYREWEYGRAIQGEPYFKIAKTLGVTLHELLVGEKPETHILFEMMDRVELDLKELRSELNSFF